MTYERDRDQALKGVGAIAARDAGNPSRQALRVRQAQMTQARDRTMSRIGYDARGLRRGALGAVDQTSDVWAGPQSDVPSYPTKLYEGAGSMTPPRTATTVSATIAYPPTVQSPPFAVPTQSPPFVPITQLPVLAMPPIMAPPAPDQTAAAGLTDAQKKWALIGVAGLAAYLLFRSGGPAT